jgi:hypothetical protein
VDQSKLPAEPARLDARVKNVDLPDGTVLDVVLTDCGAAPAGRMTLSRGEGRLAPTLESCQVGRTSSISVVHAGVRTLQGGSPWQV